jgi:hypothetical protein
VLHIGIDPQEIGRNYEGMRLLGDARATLDALTDALGRHTRDRCAIERRIASTWVAFDRERASFLMDAEPILAERVLAAIQKRLGPETVIAADASYSSSWVAGQLRTCHSTKRVISPRGLAGLGWGLPLALQPGDLRGDVVGLDVEVHAALVVHTLDLDDGLVGGVSNIRLSPRVPDGRNSQGGHPECRGGVHVGRSAQRTGGNAASLRPLQTWPSPTPAPPTPSAP